MLHRGHRCCIQGILSFLLFLDTFCIQGILSISFFQTLSVFKRLRCFSCFQTLSVLKGFCRFFCFQTPYTRNFQFLLFLGRKQGIETPKAGRGLDKICKRCIFEIQSHLIGIVFLLLFCAAIISFLQTLQISVQVAGFYTFMFNMKVQKIYDIYLHILYLHFFISS